MASEQKSGQSNILAFTLVTVVLFHIALSAAILVELRGLSQRFSPQTGGQGTSAEQGLSAGDQAPAFRLRDDRDQEITLAHFEKRKVMLVFSSDQCRFCKDLYPELESLRGRLEQQGIELAMLQLGSTVSQNRILARSQGFAFPVLAADRETFGAFSVPGTPFSTLVDEDGKVVTSGVISSREQLASLVGSAISIH